MTRTGLSVVLAVVALLAGCRNEAQTDAVQPVRSATEARKAELLSTIATRFENPAAHYELGKIYHQDGMMERAEYHYNVAIGFDPMNRRAQAALVRLYRNRQDPQRAQITADLYINQAATNPDALMALGRAFQQEGLDDLALQCYQKAVTLDPNSASIHKQLGYFFLAKGDRIRAESYFRRSIEIDINQPDVAAELGRMGIEVKIPPRKATGLLGPLRDAMSQEPEDPTVK